MFVDRVGLEWLPQSYLQWTLVSDMDPDYQLGLESIDREYDRVECPVDGEIPSWLSGTLFRNGPGRFEVDGQALTHWFDGLAMLRRFHISDGTVTFSNRFLRSKEYRHVTEQGELRCDQFGTTAPNSLVGRITGLLNPMLTDNASISVDRIGTEPIAITETPNAVGFDPETLETTETDPPDDGVSITGSLGHPHYDFDRETVINMGVRFGRKSEYVLFERPVESPIRRRIASIEVDRPAYFHSFGLTAGYAILLESPLRLTPRSLLSKKSFIESYTWDDSRDSQLVVFDRQAGELIGRFAVEPCFVFHHVNAFERGDQLVVDVIAFEDDTVIDSLTLDRLRGGKIPAPGGELRRYLLSLGEGRLDERTLQSGPLEFPMLNYRQVVTQPYQYLYAAGHTDDAADAHGLLNALVKFDLAADRKTVWSEPGVYPSEPVFVARRPPDSPEAEAASQSETQNPEDDGVILSVVLDTNAEQSALLVVDASSFSEIARAALPTAFPFGFHGQWYPSTASVHRTMP